MFTVVPNIRNSNLYLISAVAIMIAVLLTVANVHPVSHASVSAGKSVSWMGSPAYFEYRRGEWSPSLAIPFIGSAAFYEYRQGEWSINLNPDREAAYSLFRQDERNARLSPDLRDISNYLHRQGEWFGK